jgi:hypothetical protein
MTDSKLFTTAGITVHSADNVSINKVRFGTDQVRMIKMLSNAKKIWHTETKQCLQPKRVDFVELPVPMSKTEAIKFLMTQPLFQSADDQALLQESLGSREPKQKSARAKSSPKVRATLAELSLDSIKSRARKTDSTVTVEDVLATVAE